MGFSVPAAMGAALGRPDKETWAITGDGGFQMTSQELMTLVAGPHPGEDRPARQQEARDDPPVAGDHLRRQLPLRHLPGPDFAKLAEAYRHSRLPGTDARTRSTTRSARPRRVDGPALIWFEIAEEQNVFPMMPAGKGLSDLIEKWGGADE